MDKKWIINDGSLKMGTFDLFFEMAKDHSLTTGSGYFEIDIYTMQIWLFGQSKDFGPANWAEIARAIKLGDYPNKFRGYKFYFCHTSILSVAKEYGIALN